MQTSFVFKPVLYSIFLILYFTGCNDSDRTKKNRTLSNDSEPSTDWTVMVFIDGDNNLEQAAVEDFQEMARVGSNERVNIIAQMDLIGKYYNIGWTQALRFRVNKSMDPTPQNAIMDIGEANMGDPKVLGEFVRWSIQKYPAKKYALIIWDHGQGYRLYSASRDVHEINKLFDFKDSTQKVLKSPIDENLESSNNVHLLVGDPFRSVSDNPFKSCSNDETNKDQLYNREIQDGLLSVLDGRKLDVLGFDACLMGMVETGYAMRKLSNNFVASEELEPGSGWKYDDWLGRLTSEPSMNGQELSKMLVKSYASTYGNFSAQTLSAVDLRNFEQIAQKISKFSNSLKAKLNTELSTIKKAREECNVYAPNPYNDPTPKDYFFHIDFVQFCDELISRTNDPQLKTDAKNAKDAIIASVFENYSGSFRKGKFGSYGLAIYFPVSNTQYNSDLFEQGGYKKGNTFYPVEFVQKETWADFLHAYFKVVP